MDSDRKLNWDINETLQTAKMVFGAIGDLVPIFQGFTDKGFYIIAMNIPDELRGDFCDDVQKFFSAFGVSRYTVSCLLHTNEKDYLTVTGVSKSDIKTTAFQITEENKLSEEAEEIGNLAGTLTQLLPYKYNPDNRRAAVEALQQYGIDVEFHDKTGEATTLEIFGD